MTGNNSTKNEDDRMTGTVFIQPQKMGHFLLFLKKKFFSKEANPNCFLEFPNLWFIQSKNKSWQDFLLEKKNFKGKITLHHIFWTFQNFLVLPKIHLNSWNFAHILKCPKTTSTPKIRRFCWKFSEIFHFLSFFSFGCHTHKNWWKISNRKRNLCKWVLITYAIKDFFLV